jgi:hypothetical protein
MAQFYYPSQNRYNDPYQQRVTTLGSLFREKYLSRASNDITKMFGDNILISGLDVTPSFLGSVITLQFTPGILIHDSTAIAITATSTLDCNVSALADTPVGNAHLGVFTDFQYFESGDPVTQTPLKLTVYHVNSTGTPTAFAGSPAFSANRNKLLIAIINFTKSGANVAACSEAPVVLVADQAPYLTVSGVNYYLRGMTSSNINFYEIYNDLVGAFLAEFLFQDHSRG